MLLDVFMSFAVPVMIIGAYIAEQVHKRGIRFSQQEMDSVDKKYNLKKKYIVISVIMFGIYALVVASIFDELGNVFLAYIVSILSLMPFALMTILMIFFYTMVVHIIQKLKKPY